MVEAMDRLVSELKMDENAKQFLTKVSKRDAPDYYEVIKQPMDLGTLQRNVRSSKYKKKDSFIRDLELIWKNCEFYNGPGHPITVSAHYLRNKAKQLLAYIHEGDEVGEAFREWERKGFDAAVAKGGLLGRLPLSVPTAMASLEAKDSTATGQEPGPSSKPFEARPAFKRTPSGMRKLLELEYAAALPSFEPATDQDAAWWAIAEEELISGAPSARASERLSFARGRTKTRRSLTAAFGGAAVISRNVGMLQKLRYTTSKFAALASHTDMDTPLPAWLASTSSDEEEEEEEDEMTGFTPPTRPSEPILRAGARKRRALGPPVLEDGANPSVGISSGAARRGLDIVAQTMSAHVGFESARTSALELISDLMEEYLSNIGRTLRLYADGYANEMSTEDLLRRNRAAYKDCLNASAVPMGDDAFFAPENDTLVSGAFADELGDDFFGFKAMGIEAETGMSGLSVPRKLFLAKDVQKAKRADVTQGGPNEDTLQYSPPQAYVPLTESAVSAQIGLLQPWYRELMRNRGRWRARSDAPRRELNGFAEATENGDVASEAEDRAEDGEVALSDDEQERQRFRIAPTGKMPKRQILGPTAAISLANGSATRPMAKAMNAKAGGASAEMTISGAARKRIKA
ncbi:Histone acetyltransferase SAGA/ADA, catalytic subunit PCAF/GCN5 and related proteins [Ceraceosorus bombacis]|uniref:Histone acetyltransferase SAGA/ADA, catalytic subunit PCAF/GCN5 and related proteins n=1 Tax=Ceraceosorus bombacis TaxID=401625 RepID=A0A0P1B9E3_9BASI|nr:Histone acetyltransferase SAGA/ADA, catalytic subunit PCAF/GCN5 and related proteins [Ceraceosorus bombacis]